MLRRLLILLAALVLILGGIVLALRFARRGEEPSGGPTSSPRDMLPEAGGRDTPIASPTPSGRVLSLACPESWADLLDGDGDGLPDDAEVRYGTDAAKGDTDDDGHSDSDEVRAGFDPAKKEGNPRLDSDNDGLLEHEECEWKTDPFRADTDGDGFPDGEEVRNKFDPTVKGDGQGSDALTERRVRAAQQTLEQFRPNPNSDNLTEQLAARLFGDRPLEEFPTFSPSPEEIARAINQFPVPTLPPNLPLSDIRVASENTPAGIGAYLAALDRIRPADLGDAGAVANAIESGLQGNPTVVHALRTRLLRYVDDLRVLPTPPSAVAHHLHLISMVSFTTDRLEEVERFAITDPVRAQVSLLGLQQRIPVASEKLEGLRRELESLSSGA